MRRLCVIVVLLGVYPLLLITALWPSPLWFAAVAVVSYAAELVAPRSFLAVLSKVHLGATLRFTIREMAALLLVARTAGADSPWFVALAAGLFAMHGVRAVQTGLAVRLRHTMAQMPVTTRNIDVSELRIPPEPPEFLTNYRGVRFLYLDALPVLGAAVSATAGAAGAGVALLLGLAGSAALLPYVRRAEPLTNAAWVLEVVERQVRAYEPEVVLYFSGVPQGAYQVRMWLGTMERVGRRTIVVLRERGIAELLGPTSLPVVCIPSSADLMGFHALSSARLCLYVANVGKNIHMLRIQGMRSAFIGHGDSDKEASFNPFSKVYDEVWVAGPAGRDRYLRAKVGVRDENVHEVGRPQLDGVSHVGPALPYMTVLYAPTWEGWTDDLYHTSLTTMGPRLVKALLERGVRVIYKPHPLTGHRDKAARRAGKKIVAMLESANLANAKARHPSSGGAGPRVTHLIVAGQQPHLYECFNEADVMIGDISSVVSDFLASGKPYAVTNVSGMPARAFAERYPSSEAGVLIGRDLEGLDVLLDGPDTLAEARRKLRTYQLGPDYPDAMTRFRTSVERAFEGW
ncbi:CDP-glycerol glycerophosphotransferase family protein [Nonomuraea sp. NPDC050663]|uniref:CDP-glycerol glycerophosphotransferase family protein n=1 Tax=Nonomuraea sp. NPDC050663 TaxID=3364370 RepID=UPI0037BADA5A